MPAVLMRLVALAALALSAGLASAQLNLLPLPGGVPGYPLSTVKIVGMQGMALTPDQGAGYLNAYEAVSAVR